MSKDVPADSLEYLYATQSIFKFYKVLIFLDFSSIKLIEQYKSYPWFHGVIPRINCEEALTKFGKVGDYVIRIREKVNIKSIY